MSLDIYAEELIYNYEHPDNKGKMEKADAKMYEENTSCGDSITVYLKIKDGKIDDIKFEGSGCVISMGSANILANYIKGKTLAELEKMGKETVIKAISIDPGPVRMHCATLSLRAVKEAIFAYEKKPVDRETKEL